jgi:PAS domain S-box-containing protein
MPTPSTRILVIEDEPAHAEAIRRSLESMDGTVLRVLNSLAGYREHAVAWNPDLALMDLNLPDGRATEVLPDPSESRPFPIIVMTSYGSEQTAVEALKAGAFDYLVKSPETFRGLPHILERLLREWQVKAEGKRIHLELKASEANLREAFQFNEQIIRSAQEGVIVYDLDLKYLVWNPFMEQMSGVTAAEVLGRHPLEVFPFLREMGVVDRLQRALAGETVGPIEFPFHVPSTGKSGWNIDASAALRNAKGEIIGVIGTVIDITERKRAEEEQLKLQAQLQQAQKIESLGSLAGGVAHDMNNVLGAILGVATASIETVPPGSPAYQAFSIISQAAVRGGKMVKSLLSFARQSPAEECETDINEILREDVRMLERTTLCKVRLELDLASDLRPVLGDPSALTHAFMNLCVNAVDAMPEHGILTLRTRNLDNAWIEVLVEDTGSGMSKEVLERALDPFFTTKEQGKGTGLGLSIVYRTVKAHRGQVEIQSRPGQGTLVRIRFPACEPAAQAHELEVKLPPAASRGTLNILVVDDDELIQGSTQSVLEFLGHSVTIAPCGEDALAKVDAGLQPDLVILDMNMPGWGGTGTLPRLRALRPGLPVLLATGRADQAALDLISAHPGVSLLAKPFGAAELKQVLESMTRG